MSVAHVQHRPERDRRAFTLVELLVVISIIGILTSMTLFTLYGVREDAKDRRARAQIAKINEMIMQQWESYRTRAVPVSVPYGTSQLDASQLRLSALRELMRMELPDRKSDLLFPVNVTAPPQFLRSNPALWRVYIRRARQQIIGKYGTTTSADAWKDDAFWTPLHQHAECLYMILATMRDGDITGLDFFTEGEMGDVDEDGMPEILDPWGVPIYFLRWAPGFISDIQPGDLEPTIDGNAGNGNGDLFDPLKADPRWSDSIPDNDPFLLFPLVMSAGRDKTFDILVDFLPLPFPEPLPWVLAYNNPPTVSPPLQNLANDPYVTFEHPTLGVAHIGVLADVNGDGAPGYTDNITNHLIEVR